MSIGSTIRAGAAHVEVTAETSKLQRNLTSAQAWIISIELWSAAIILMENYCGIISLLSGKDFRTVVSCCIKYFLYNKSVFLPYVLSF